MAPLFRVNRSVLHPEGWMTPVRSLCVVGLGKDCGDITQVGMFGAELARFRWENRTFAAGI